MIDDEAGPESGGPLQKLLALAAAGALGLIWGALIYLFVLAAVSITIGRAGGGGDAGKLIAAIAGLLWVASMALALHKGLRTPEPKPAENTLVREADWARQRDEARGPGWMVELLLLPATMSVAALLSAFRPPEAATPLVVRRRPAPGDEFAKASAPMGKKRNPEESAARRAPPGG